MANLRVDKITSTETFEKTGSVQFDGTDDGLTISDNAAFDLGTGDFTIEGWYYIKQQGSYLSLFDWRGSGGDGVYPALIKHSSGDFIYFYVDAKYRITNVTIQYNTWFHVTVCRSSGITKLFIDGKEQGRFADTLDYISRDILLGLGASNSNDLAGNISNYRVVKGRALYTENFKPPMRELENVPGTVLLCCQSKDDATLEKTGKTITATGNAVASELTPGLLTPVPKAGAGSAIKGSVEFNLNGDGLVLSKSTDFAFGTGNFTIEGWFNVSDTGAIRTLFDSRTTDNNSTGIFIGINTDDNLYTYGFPSGTGVVNYGVPKHGEWHHFAVVRSGFTGFVFLNGIKISEQINTGSTNYTDQGAAVGQPSTAFAATLYRYKGFLSNIRVNKGTALYTSDFTPPARELKNIPGTVLLCCQDPDNPLTEATGKTITGFGNLDQVYNTQLVPNGDFSDGTNDWSDTGSTATLSVSSGQMTITNSSGTNGRATGSAFKTTIGARYVLKYDAITSGGSYRAEIREASGGGAEQAFESTTDGVTETFEFQATHNQHSVVIYSIGANGVATKYGEVYVSKVNPGKTGSNFTPQVGDDRKVTFEGVTKVNSDAYFYLPTGDTLSREATGSYNAGTRGLFGGGLEPSVSQDEVQFINIATLGDAKDFGNLTEDRWGNGACASDTRALWGAGLSASPNQYYNVIDYVTIMTKGDAKDFGDLTYGVPYYTAAVSNTTRGIWGGGYNTPSSPLVPSPFPSGFQNEMEYVTIASKGNGIDFGDFTARNSMSTFGSPTRGCFAGGATPTRINTIEYITIASTGDAQDFGDLIAPINYGGGCSNSIRAIVFGGYNGAADANTNVISYNTIASTGNAQDFGDLTTAKSELGACSSATRGVVGGGWSPVKIDEMDYITIASTGDAKAFGELINVGVYAECGTSNGHGGLG